jgi:chloride channel protein, CIC family
MILGILVVKALIWSVSLGSVLASTSTVIYTDEPLRIVVHRMADTGHTELPVVQRGPTRRVVGLLSLEDLLKARLHYLDSERRRERVMSLRLSLRARGTLPARE